MSLYDTYLTLHVLMAIVWLGGGLAISILGWRLSRAAGGATMAAFGRQVEWVGTHVFTPASLVLLVLGFLLIHEGGWSYASLWIALALALYAVTFLTGAAYLGPQSGRLGKLVEAHGVEAPEVRAHLQRLLFVSRLDLITLYTIAGLMLVKPTADDVLVLAIGAASIAALAAAVVRTHRSDPAPDASVETT